jgi:hypothetical protein
MLESFAFVGEATEGHMEVGRFGQSTIIVELRHSDMPEGTLRDHFALMLTADGGESIAFVPKNVKSTSES